MVTNMRNPNYFNIFLFVTYNKKYLYNKTFFYVSDVHPLLKRVHQHTQDNIFLAFL